jgi:hypothetical protein
MTFRGAITPLSRSAVRVRVFQDGGIGYQKGTVPGAERIGRLWACARQQQPKSPPGTRSTIQIWVSTLPSRFFAVRGPCEEVILVSSKPCAAVALRNLLCWMYNFKLVRIVEHVFEWFVASFWVTRHNTKTKDVTGVRYRHFYLTWVDWGVGFFKKFWPRKP